MEMEDYRTKLHRYVVTIETDKLSGYLGSLTQDQFDKEKWLWGLTEKKSRALRFHDRKFATEFTQSLLERDDVDHVTFDVEEYNHNGE